MRHPTIQNSLATATRRAQLAAFACLVAMSLSSAALAQQNPPRVSANSGASDKGRAANPTARTEPPSAATTRAPENAAAQGRSPISSGQALYLVRSALLTLNDANRSGNYTVLRDLAAPDFQARNSAADLAQSFADLRRRNFDLFAAALLAPQFTPQPALDSNGRLRLTGFFPTRPLQISFDMTFQSVGGQWRLFAVSVATPEAPKPAQSQLDRQVPPHQAGPFYRVRALSGIAGWRW